MRHPAAAPTLRMCGGMGRFNTHSKATRPRGARALIGSMLACVMIAASTMTAVAIRPAEAASGASIVNLTCQSKNSFINTGRNQSTGKKMTSGTDPVWEFVNTGTNVTSPTQIPSTYWTSAKVSDFAADLGMPNAWVKSPYNNANWAGVLDLGENSYNWYRMRVNIDDDVALSTLKVTVKGAADDALGAVYVNGTSVAFTPVSFQNVGTIATLSGPWQTGLNTIIFRTWNVSNPSGLLLSADDTPIACQEKDPNISASTVASPTIYGEDTNVTFTTTVKNTGNVPLTNISITSELSGGTMADPVSTCPATSLEPGESMDCIAHIHTSRDDVNGYASIPFTAFVSGRGDILGGQTKWVTNQSTVTIYPPAPGITSTTVATPSGYGPNTVVTVTTTVRNTGGVGLTGVKVTSTLDTTAIPAPTFTCLPTMLAVGASATCTASFTPGATGVSRGSIAITATASGTYYRATHAAVVTHRSYTGIYTQFTPELISTTVATPTDYGPGTALSFTTTVKNTGDTPLTGINVTSALNTTAVSAPTFTCPATTLAVGESTTCTATITTTAAAIANMDLDSINLTARAAGTGATTKGNSTEVSRTNIVTVYRRYILTFDKVEPTATVSATTVSAVRGAAWGTLPTWTASGKAFDGWYTAKTGGTQITASTLATADQKAYAHWHPTTFIITFHPNAQIGTVSGAMPSVTYDSGCTSCTLPLNAWTKSTGAPELITENETAGDVKSSFLGWSLDPDSSTAGIADGAPAGGLSQGGSVDLYAVWDDAPSFHHDPYPNRFFTLDEAKSGLVTETALLSTVEATDRETNPLIRKTARDVTNSGNDVGITLFDYNATDFTSMTADGTVSLTYKVKDDASNVAFLRITVTVTSGDPLPTAELTHLRAISNDFIDKPSNQGGLSDQSPWKNDQTHKDALEAALSGDDATCYRLGPDALAGIKDQVSTSGFGNSKNPDGLAGAFALLSKTPCD